jgi:hypothetical protein
MIEAAASVAHDPAYSGARGAMAASATGPQVGRLHDPTHLPSFWPVSCGASGVKIDVFWLVIAFIAPLLMANR